MPKADETSYYWLAKAFANTFDEEVKDPRFCLRVALVCAVRELTRAVEKTDRDRRYELLEKQGRERANNARR